MRQLTAPYQVLSLVGNTKNAGKTTALNAMIAAWPDKPLGVTSIGLDGEALDAVSRLPKPRIHLPAGSLAATSEECLKDSQISWRLRGRTGIRTSMGEVVLVEVTSPGYCLVGGPSTVTAMAQVVDALKALGAHKVLIDGAFARDSHATAGEAMVFIVGAHQSPSMERVVRNADYALRRFALQQAEPALCRLLEDEGIGWVDGVGMFHPIQMPSALGAADAVIDQVPWQARWLYLPLAAGPQFIRRFVQRRKEHVCGLILEDATALVAEDDALRHLFLMERPMRVLRPMQVAFVVANPVSPSGWRFDNRAFLAALGEVTELPVVNVLEDDAIETSR